PAGSVSSTFGCFCTQRSRQVVTTRSNAADNTQCSRVIPSGLPKISTSTAAPQPGTRPRVTGKHRQIGAEPLLQLRAVLRTYDRRRAQAKNGALLFEFGRERRDARARRRWMTEKWIEHDFIRAGVGGGARVVRWEDFGR